MASEHIVHGPTCSDCLLLQGLISGGALRYKYYYSSSTVVQRCSTSNMYKAKPNIHNKRARPVCLTHHAASIVEFQPLNRSYSQQTFFILKQPYPDARNLLKKLEIRSRFQDTILRTSYRYSVRYLRRCSPCHFLVKSTSSYFGEHYWR